MIVRKLEGEKKYYSLEKNCIFITGCPRSGTSMLTKIIDAHPDIGILMENIFENRRRHWTKASFWHNRELFKKELDKIYSKINEPIVGNKVINPDVWSLDDILQFCNVFKDFKIIWIVRNPRDVILSRLKREKKSHYNTEALRFLPLDYSSVYSTWASSWNQSILAYQICKEFLQKKVILVYYDDFVLNFNEESKLLFNKLEIPYSDEVNTWEEIPHLDKDGLLRNNLKYKDRKVMLSNYKIDDEIKLKIREALSKYEYTLNLWENRAI